MFQKCCKCGCEINDSIDLARVVNRGLDSEQVMCENCFDVERDRDSMVSCVACGEWFATSALHGESLDETHTFTPCPCCGKDIVEGQTREEMLADAAPLRYAVIVTFVNGCNRGYIVHAQNRPDALRKVLDVLAKRVDGHSVASINISEVLLSEDEIN